MQHLAFCSCFRGFQNTWEHDQNDRISLKPSEFIPLKWDLFFFNTFLGPKSPKCLQFRTRVCNFSYSVWLILLLLCFSRLFLYTFAEWANNIAWDSFVKKKRKKKAERNEGKLVHCWEQKVHNNYDQKVTSVHFNIKETNKENKAKKKTIRIPTIVKWDRPSYP